MVESDRGNREGQEKKRGIGFDHKERRDPKEDCTGVPACGPGRLANSRTTTYRHGARGGNRGRSVRFGTPGNAWDRINFFLRAEKGAESG